MADNRRSFLQFLAQTSDAPYLLEVDRAEGIYLYAPDGKKYFDLEQKPQPQWQSLKDAVENNGRENPYPVPGRYLMRCNYIDCIADAEEVEPEEA